MYIQGKKSLNIFLYIAIKVRLFWLSRHVKQALHNAPPLSTLYRDARKIPYSYFQTLLFCIDRTSVFFDCRKQTGWVGGEKRKVPTLLCIVVALRQMLINNAGSCLNNLVILALLYVRTRVHVLEQNKLQII